MDQGLILGIVFKRIVFIDFQKAFNMVPHDLLPQKLLAVGIFVRLSFMDNELLKWKTTIVEVNGVTSETKSIRCGVPQGSLIGPRLLKCLCQ